MDSVSFLALSLNHPIRKSFKRFPTTTEWAHFRKYARRMRDLRQWDTPDSPSKETFSAIQLCIANEPLLPNLKTLTLAGVRGWFVPFIPLFLSPKTTSVFLSFKSTLPEVIVASMTTTLPTLCPDLKKIALYGLPKNSMITTAVSGMLLVTNRNNLHGFRVDSPLTEEASEVLYELPELRSLEVVIERETRLPSASLPNLTELVITCDNEDGWPQLFHGATLGKLEHVDFYLQSGQIGDFLGAFERAALSSSLQNTLSGLSIFTGRSWNPNYSSLLPFTQMVDLRVYFTCNDGCSSRVDDDIIINLSRAMPKLKSLGLGDAPCRQITTGVTTKGFLALAHHCPKLSTLCVHFQVASLGGSPGIPGMAPTAGPAGSWTDCALTELDVGETPVPEGSAMTIALTLIRIFPRLCFIECIDGGWEEVKNAINRSQEIIDCSSKQRPFTTPRGTLNDHFTGVAFETSG